MRRLTLIALAILAMIALSGAVVTPPRSGGASLPANVADWYGTSTGVGNDADAQLLLHFEADTATPWSDSSLSGQSQPTVSSANRSEVQEKFGDSSALFVAASNQYLEWAAHEDWDLSAGDFTIDFQVRFVSLPADGNQMIIACHYKDNSNQTAFTLKNIGGTYYLRFFYYDSGSFSLEILRSAAIAVDTWYHFAVTRDGDDHRIFLDGTQLGATVNDAAVAWTGSAPLHLGTCTPTSAHFNGYLDEFRWSRGKARWVANFTAPTAKYGGLTLWLEDSEGNAYPAQGWIP